MMKRILDLLASIFLLVIFSPVICFLSIAVFFSMGRPIFFMQARAGIRGEIFHIIKFRSMKECSNKGSLSPNSDLDRITPLGSFLRNSSLDELPSLINVIKGEMSMVGPRPLLVDYLPLYSSKQARRHEIKPGITGYAQVNGRNSISWEEKFEHDVWYVENQSLWLDIKIIILTVKKVFLREGVNQDENITMSRFTGAIPKN
ncbi:MAG: sugar transferase [Pseudomonadales bacterium]|nr:sugar transferase [Pseudomonadales bacterium]